MVLQREDINSVGINGSYTYMMDSTNAVENDMTMNMTYKVESRVPHCRILCSLRNSSSLAPDTITIGRRPCTLWNPTRQHIMLWKVLNNRNFQAQYGHTLFYKQTVRDLVREQALSYKNIKEFYKKYLTPTQRDFSPTFDSIHITMNGDYEW